MNPVSTNNITVAYHRKPVIQNVSFEAPEGKLIGIVGPNGAGKSTLIKSILGLVPKASGNISIYGKPYKKQRQIVGYVPQRGSVDWDFPTNALDVVLMGKYGQIGLFRRPNKIDKQEALECLAQVGWKLLQTVKLVNCLAANNNAYSLHVLLHKTLPFTLWMNRLSV